MNFYGCLLTHCLPKTNILFMIVRICHSQFKCNYLKNEKLFLNVWLHFRNLHQILNVPQKRVIVIANVFPKLQTVKNLVRSLSKKGRFSTRFDCQHVKASQILKTSPWGRFYLVFSSFPGKLIRELSLQDWDEILGVFVKTLTAEDKYRVLDWENL